jgi:hypothetical protein
MLVEIDMRGEFAAGRDLVQAAGVKLGVGDKALNAGHAFEKVDEMTGMDRVEIELPRVSEPGLGESPALDFVGVIVTTPVAPVQPVKIRGVVATFILVMDYGLRGRRRAAATVYPIAPLCR